MDNIRRRRDFHLVVVVVFGQTQMQISHYEEDKFAEIKRKTDRL